jgi:hypothetical protein
MFAIVHLKEAIRITRKVVTKTPESKFNWLHAMINLGIYLNSRYSTTRTKADLEEAIQVTKQAINAVLKDYPDQAWTLKTYIQASKATREGHRLGMQAGGGLRTCHRCTNGQYKEELTARSGAAFSI